MHIIFFYLNIQNVTFKNQWHLTENYYVHFCNIVYCLWIWSSELYACRLLFPNETFTKAKRFHMKLIKHLPNCSVPHKKRRFLCTQSGTWGWTWETKAGESIETHTSASRAQRSAIASGSVVYKKTPKLFKMCREREKKCADKRLGEDIMDPQWAMNNSDNTNGQLRPVL